MKYCRFCGKTIDDDSSFCTHCGKAQTSQDSETAFEAIGGSGSRFIKAATGYVQRMYMKIQIQKFYSNSKVWSAIKKWTKRIVVLTLVLIAIGIFVLLGFWLYGFYQTSKWDKEDERREAIALKDISKADKIARELFDEYANDIHQYEFDYSRCNFDHVERGIAIIRNAAEKGDASAQFTLGCIYAGARYDKKNIEWHDDRTMMDTEINNERAAYWWNQAAIQGNASAMGNLANEYWYGGGVEKDLFKATELMKAAAEKGNSMAQLNYGDMFRDGDVWIRIESDSITGGSLVLHAKPDIEKAKEWWTKALENGNESAKERLEKIYE